MNNVYLRIVGYMAFGGAVVLSARGLATFDTTTWSLDILPFDVRAAGGALASLAAPFAIFKRWGVK